MTEINKQYVEYRIQDWKERLDTLYTFVERALSNNLDIICKKNRTTSMHEEFMQEFGVDKEVLSLLDIYKNKKIVATFKPIGLWVVGANGRVDILTELGAYIIIDTSGKGDEPAWQVYTPENRRTGREFNSSFISELVNSA